MPPKAKFTKEQMLAAALDIVRESGIDALSSRTLGKKLGTSSCPVFTAFENMEELQTAVKKAAMSLYSEYIKLGLQDTPAFKGVGMQYIRFAIQEPKLFQLLFMSEQINKPTVANVLPVIDDNYPQILASVERIYNIGREDAENVYRHLWIYSHGIAVLAATNMCVFTPDEIGKMTAEIIQGLLKKIKN